MTQFPVEISNEDAFASFKNVRNVTIKKVTDATDVTRVERSVNDLSFCRATKV